jgi:DME family drug/metabolite transporter
MRMVIAAALLATAASLLGGSGQAPGTRGDRWRCLAAGVCNAGFQAAYFTSVTLAGIAITALVAICSAPILIAGLAVLLLGERPAARLLVSLALGVAYALYVVIAKAAVARMAPLSVAAWTFAAAAVVMAPALAQDGVVRQIELGWPWLLYLGAVTTAGAYAVYTIGLRYVPAAAAGVAALLEPLTATLLGTVVFGERLTASGWIGAALLVGALGLVLVPERAAQR